MTPNMKEAFGLITSQVTKAEEILSCDIRSIRDLRNLEAEVRTWDLLNRDILHSCGLATTFLAGYERLANEPISDTDDLRSSITQLREAVRARLEVLRVARDRLSASSHLSPRTESSPAQMNIFLVHGHDRAFLYEAKDYLQNTLGLPEPIVLSQKAGGGRTVIEKFEDYASEVDAAVVLLSPDDVGGKTDDTSGKRARQNVIFELGYFVGKLGRKSGRIILLMKRDVDIPSDLAGIIYIEVEDGVEAAGERIRKEFQLLTLRLQREEQGLRDDRN